MTETTSTIASVGQDIAWVKGHILAVVLAIALIAGSIIGGIGMFESLIEKHDARVAAAQQRKEGIDTATQAALVAQLQQDRQANAARDAQNTAMIQSLIAQMARQHAETAQQVKTDATLDMADAGARLAAQTKAGPGDVVVTATGITLSAPESRTVVTDLDLLPQAQNDITNLQGQLNAQQTLTTDAKSELVDSKKIIDADKVELIATIKADNDACTVRVDKQKATDRKHALWLSILSMIAGGFLGHQL